MKYLGKKGRFRSHSIWWINPKYLIAFVIAPVFLLSSWYGKEIMNVYGSINFIDNGILVIGLGSLLACIYGCWIGEKFASVYNPSGYFNRSRVDRAIFILTIISIFSHILLMGAILSDLGTVISAMRGTLGAIYQVKKNMNKISGVTSFTQLYLISIPLYASYYGIFGRRPPYQIRMAHYILIFLIFIRAFVILERFAIIEAAVPLFLCALTFRSARSRLSGYYPVIGLIAVYILFAAGEYTRTWAYNQSAYDSFWEYVNLRGLGYIATATNNAAGVLHLYGGMWGPFFTATWIRRLPIWDIAGDPFEHNPMKRYFNEFGNEEFNNPSGILAGALDYGLEFYIIFYLIIGIIGGFLYVMFRRGNAFGIVYFPGWYLGFLLLTQLVYWAEPRFFTVSIIAPIVAIYISGRQADR